jgi:hypothetical protein
MGRRIGVILVFGKAEYFWREGIDEVLWAVGVGQITYVFPAEAHWR